MRGTGGLAWLRRMTGVLLGNLDARARLVALAIASFLPLCVLIAQDLHDARSQALASAMVNLQTVARLSAERQADVIEEAQEALGVLARIPEVVESDNPACHELLRRVMTDHPHLNTMMVARPDGTLACHSMVHDPVGLTLDAGFAARVMRTADGTISLGARLLSAVTGRATVVAAIPIPRSAAPASQRPGILAATLNLDWLAALMERLPLEAHETVQLIDPRDGTIVVRNPDLEEQAGMRLPDGPLLRAIRGQPSGGVTEAPDGQGATQLVAFAPLPRLGDYHVIAITADRAQVLAGITRRLWTKAALAAAALVAALVVALVLGQMSHLRPLALLLRAAARLGAGELSTRVRLATHHAREYRRIGDALNHMAAGLESRDAQVREAQASLEENESRLRLITDTMADMILWLDQDFDYKYVSPACREVVGWEPEELLAAGFGALIPEDDLPAIAAMRASLLSGAKSAEAIYRFRHKDGGLVWLEARGRRPASGVGAVLAVRDVGHIIAHTAQAERRLAESNRQLAELNRVLEAQALQDGLTGLANRRRFDRALEEEFRRAMRAHTPLALLMLDVDHFKAFNDTYGHMAGDACLRQVAQAIAQCARRPADLCARYGGEEIAVLLPDSDLGGAQVVAEHMLEAVRATHQPHAGSARGSVTVSIGVAVLTPLRDLHEPADLLQAADKALYAAKFGGRDCLRLAEEQPPPLRVVR